MKSGAVQLNEGSHLILECVCVQEDIEGMVELNSVTAVASNFYCTAVCIKKSR